MKIAILGAGRMGSSLARLWAAAGHQVAISSTRDPSEMPAFDGGISAMSTADAVREAEVVVFAIPWTARALVAQNPSWLAGKIVLDLMNAYDPFPLVVDLVVSTSSLIVAADFPSARVVKALNTISARDLVARSRPRGSEDRIAAPICGDDPFAKWLVAGLIDDLGFDALDIGGLRSGGLSEPEGLLFGRNCGLAELASLFDKCAAAEEGIRQGAPPAAARGATAVYSDSDDLEWWRPLAADEVRLWSFPLDCSEEVIECMHRSLSAAERQRAAQFRLASARTQFIVSRGMLRTILGVFRDTAPDELHFEYGENGKPRLGGPATRPKLHFNVSHSGSMGVCALTRIAELGVDVEIHHPMPDLQTIARRYFSGAEYKKLMRLPEDKREAAFFDCWVRKEAYIKAVGGGLSIPLDSFSVSLAPDESANFLTVNGSEHEAKSWFLGGFSPAPRYSGAVAVRCPEARLQVHNVSSVLQMLAVPVS